MLGGLNSHRELKASAQNAEHSDDDELMRVTDSDEEEYDGDAKAENKLMDSGTESKNSSNVSSGLSYEYDEWYDHIDDLEIDFIA